MPAWLFYPLVIAVIGGALAAVYLVQRRSDAAGEYRGPEACPLLEDDQLAELLDGAPQPLPRRSQDLDVDRTTQRYGRFGTRTSSDNDVVGSSCRFGALLPPNLELSILRASQVGTRSQVHGAIVGGVLPADRTDRSAAGLLADELPGGACVATAEVPGADPDALVVTVTAQTSAGCDPVIAVLQPLLEQLGT
jgi:hypothetical protein